MARLIWKPELDLLEATAWVLRIFAKQLICRPRAQLDALRQELGPLGFVRIHRNHAVNPGHVREVRPTASEGEVRLEPPVNKVLPVSRGSLTALFEAYRPPTGQRR